MFTCNTFPIRYTSRPIHLDLRCNAPHHVFLPSLSPSGVAVDRHVVVRDLDDTISSLFSYLSANSPGPSCGSPATALSRVEANPSPFRPVAGVEATSRSLLITPPGSFHAISGDTPPPLPERGPPCEATYRGSCSPASPSPSPSCWLAGHPGGTRDRKSVISSKASSDIELVNLCKSERVKNPGSDGPADDPICREGRQSASDDGMTGSQCIQPAEARRGDKGLIRHFDADQDKSDPDGEVYEASTQHPQPRRPPLDHHYSEIDIYGAAQDTTPRTASPSPTGDSADSSPPPIPPHVEGKCATCCVGIPQ